MSTTSEVTEIRYLPLQAGARRSGMSVMSLRRLIARKRLTAYRPVGGRILLEVRQLDEYVRQSAVVDNRESCSEK